MNKLPGIVEVLIEQGARPQAVLADKGYASATNGYSRKVRVNVTTALPFRTDLHCGRFALDPRWRAKP